MVSLEKGRRLSPASFNSGYCKHKKEVERHENVNDGIK